MGVIVGAGFVDQFGAGADLENSDRYRVKDGYAAGIAVRRSLHERFGVELDVLYAAKGAARELPTGAEGNPIDLRFISVALLGDVNFPLNDAWRGSLGLGPELGYLVDAGPFDLDAFNRPELALTAAAGITWRPGGSDHVVTASLRYTLGLSQIADDTDVYNHAGMLLVGYRYQLFSSGPGTTGTGEGRKDREDEDRDGDGVMGAADKCPDQAEDIDHFEDDDGCPDTDNDNDGVADESDGCPMDAEDKDSFEDGDGCPDLDNDGDGIADTTDECPIKAEDMNGFEDGDGCPDADKDDDGDGVLDPTDKCPEAGYWTADGCPRTYETIQVGEASIELVDVETLVFRGESSDLKAGKAKATLAELAQAMLDHPRMQLRVIVRTRVLGDSPNKNRKLSGQRAAALKKAIVNKRTKRADKNNIGDRIETEGKAWEDLPQDDNKIKTRIEFAIEPLPSP